jgi:hypothetical protein
MNYDIKLTGVSKGFDGNTFWAQAGAGTISACNGSLPNVVLTAQPALRSGSDVFFALSEWESTDLGKSWQGPASHKETLGRRKESDGTVVAICGMTPCRHSATQTLLTTGQTVRYKNDKQPIIARRRETAYSVYNPKSKTWMPWQVLTMPECRQFANAGAGNAQRFDLEDGTILLPIYFKNISDDWDACFSATVLRCSFDGKELKYLEHGTEMTIPDPRGFAEPSITRYQGQYFITLRNDIRGYVATSKDGLHFDTPHPWRFDNGEELGSYNTQQHWVRHSDGLFLVYTRRGLNNDHVFRHRAPLMIAEVDTDKLTIMRETERELVPNRGARLGNFSVCEINKKQTWIIVSEWMQPYGCEKYGSDNTIWAAQIVWSKPNDLLK